MAEIPLPASPMDWLRALAELPFPVFLDSARSGDALGRYSYLAADPFLRLECRDGALWEGEQCLEKNFLAGLKKKAAEFAMEGLPGLPPFQGGAVGYWSYAMGRYIEKLPPAEAETALPDAEIGFYDLVLAIDHGLGKAYAFSSGFPAKGKAQEKKANERLRQFLDLIAKAESFHAKQLPRLVLDPMLTPEQFIQMVQAAIEYIKAGDIYQANISQSFRALLPKEYDLLSLYAALRQRNPAPFAAYLSYGDHAILSSSPERFLEVSGNNIETRPIKGTRPRHADQRRDKSEAEALLSSEKDRAENLMIVDLLRNDLSKVSVPGSVKVPILFGLESYSSVHHLVSVVTAELARGKNAFDLLAASFPGGSITGAPKIRAMEIIHELEKRERGPYCGSIFWHGFNGSMDSNIIIRTLIVEGDRIRLDTGCGIVADSNPIAEYQESLDKGRAIMKVLSHDMVE